MTLKFYTNPMSRGQIARWALHEAGADYDQVLLDYETTMKADDYLAINPMGKVPAIDHDGKIVTEGAAICAYLAEAFPDPELAPTATERATAIMTGWSMCWTANSSQMTMPVVRDSPWLTSMSGRR